MLRSALVLLDGSPFSRAAADLAIRWSRQHGGRAAGISIVNEPAIRESASLAKILAQEEYDREFAEAKERIGQYLQSFAAVCRQAGVAHAVIEETGTPTGETLLEAQRHDLLLVGKQTFLRSPSQPDDPDTLTHIVKNAPRPVVVVPEVLPAGDATVIAYDGSLQSARALEAYWASGLCISRENHIISIGESERDAQVRADLAADYLAMHDVQAKVHLQITAGGVADTLLSELDRLAPGLLVMGAYGKTSLRDFFFGSVTKRVMAEADVPLFLDH